MTHRGEGSMNLRQLQYFVEVSEVQSVTKAATRLNLAQPALTRHIRTLERDLGVQLFSRSGRGIALTNAGAVFRDRVKSILRDLDRAQLEVQALSRSPRGRIDIGRPPRSARRSRVCWCSASASSCRRSPCASSTD